MPRAGFCPQCGSNVWVAPNGRCAACGGHVRSAYDVAPIVVREERNAAKPLAILLFVFLFLCLLSQAPLLAPPSPSTSSGTWTAAAGLAGTGNGGSADYFHLSGSDARLRYVITQPSDNLFGVHLTVRLREKGDTIGEEVLTADKTGSGTIVLPVDHEGDYYLKVESFGSDVGWQLTIEERR